MKKNTPPENIRKTVYIKYTDAEKIKLLAEKENRTFSSFVAILLKNIANQQGEQK